MKKFLTLAAFLFAVMFSSTTFAANWTAVDSEEGATMYVDKDSIKREIHSKFCGVDRADGFSANVKLEFVLPDGRMFKMINLIGFFEDNGVKKMIFLERLDDNGNIAPDAEKHAEEQKADGSDGTVWPKVFDYVQKNLP